MTGARVVYSAIASLDGYVVDAQGRFDWAAPSESVHRFVNDRERAVGTYLYGRRMYEVMSYWAAPDSDSDRPRCRRTTGASGSWQTRWCTRAR